MPKKVDKNERKELILSTALKIFAREGYHDANLSLIAEESGISRPTVYQYFQDKNEIFYFAVKLVTNRMFDRYSEIAWAEGDESEIDRILAIVKEVLDYATNNESTISNLLEFMLSEKKKGVDFETIIKKRTAKLVILLKRLIRQGITNGNIIKCNVPKTADNIFNLIESCCFQVGFFKTFDKDTALNLITSYLDFLRAK